MNILAPLTLLAALISTILFVSSPSAHANTTDMAQSDEMPVLKITMASPGSCSGMIPRSGTSLSMDNDDGANPDDNYRLFDRPAYTDWDNLAVRGIPTELMDVTDLDESRTVDTTRSK